MTYDDDQEQPEPEYNGDELRALGQKWLERIRHAEKRDEPWRNGAEAAAKAFAHDRDSPDAGKVYDFNILHSNVETIGPAIFNSTPIPDVRERFRVGAETPESAASRTVAQVIERAIMVQTDDGALDAEMELMVQDALVAGRGVLRLRFDAEEQEVEGQPTLDPMTGELIQGEPQIVLANERIEFEVVSWRDYREGPAQRWSQVPWVAFRHCLPWEEVQRIQAPEIKEALSTGGVENTEPQTATDDADTKIWEIWCKEDRRVYMIVEHSGEVLTIVDDPMGLTGFFPMPEPVQPIMQAGSRRPIVPFDIYKKLADELEMVTRRIAAITEGLKVRGVVAGSAEDIQRLALAGDNELIPVANIEGFAATGGLDTAISWWPIDRAVQVLQQLYVNRDTTKAMIYEITGISDIVRGQGKASETATAQEIKSQWGSLRIRKLQRVVERAARDTFVLCAEIISSKFSPQTLQHMTGIPLDEMAAQMLSQPLDHYRIDIESDSTVRADLTRRKGEMGEFLNGTAAFFSTMAPVVAQSPALAGPVAQMYAAFARQFSLGKQAEDAIEELAAMAQQQAQAAQQAQQQQAQAAQEQMQKAEAREDEKIAIQRDKVTLDEKKAEVDALTRLASVDKEMMANG